MRTLALIIAIVTACPCLAAADRPQVPVVPDVAVAPRAFDERPAQAVLAVKELAAAAATAKAGVAEPLNAGSSGAIASASPLAGEVVGARIGVKDASTATMSRISSRTWPLPARDSVATVGRTNPLALETVDEAAFVRLVLSCDDDAGLRNLLTTFGLTVREAGPARALPAFLTGVDCDGPDALKAAIPAGTVRAVRYVGEDAEAVAYVAGHPDQPFVIIVDVDHLSAAALKTLSGGNIAAVIVGHFHAFDAKPQEYADRAEDVKRTVRAIRLISDAPVLLAVSSLNYFTRRTEKSWTDALGDALAGFDGWAIYNLNQFPAILESPTNPRTLILGRLGLPERPCVLLDFLGGPVSIPPGQEARLKASWQAKGGAFMKALQAQGWRGVVVYAAHSVDAQVKSAAMTP